MRLGQRVSGSGALMGLLYTCTLVNLHTAAPGAVGFARIRSIGVRLDSCGRAESNNIGFDVIGAIGGRLQGLDGAIVYT